MGYKEIEEMEIILKEKEKEIDVLEIALTEKKKEYLLKNGWELKKGPLYDFWEKCISGKYKHVFLNEACRLQKTIDLSKETEET